MKRKPQKALAACNSVRGPARCAMPPAASTPVPQLAYGHRGARVESPERIGTAGYLQVLDDWQ